jgi:uncharacterized protein YdbL (DUF1318 family)
MKVTLIFMLGVIFSLGCARVMVEAPKEPIKVDISMRLDVYQHIQNDIDDIESIVSGSKGEGNLSDKESLLDYFICNVYAQGELSPEVEEAALRRRDRHSEIISWQGQGVIGENRLGLLEVRDPQGADSSLAVLINQENSDRMIIYQAVAEKNNTSVEEVQKMYVKRLQGDAPSGTPIEVLNEATGAYEWRSK